MKLIIEIGFRGLFYFLTNQEYRNFIFLALKYSGKKRYTPFSCSVNNYKWSVVDGLSFVWQYKEIFTDKSYKFHHTTQTPVIYDCGSNIGLSCLYFALNYPHAKIHAFEPDPLVFSVLKKNILDNGFGGNITSHQNAVWISDGQLSFNADGADSGSISQGETEDNIIVESISLKELLKKESNVDLLKIDIEGAESEVIPDIKSELYKVRNVFIEYHSFRNKKQNLGEILEILSEVGFRYYLSTQNNRKSPLVDLGKHDTMDYQTNIFAYR